MRLFSSSLLAILLAVIGARAAWPATASSLAVINAGVASSESAPFAPAGYTFLPGDYLYCSFQIAGFTIRSDSRGESQKISLAYSVVPEDEANRPLLAPVTDTIEADLSPEDKNWIPIRRASFLLPSFLAAGHFHVRVMIKDSYGAAQSERVLPFEIGGIRLKPAAGLGVQNFRFVRGENDSEGLTLAAFAPGDTVYARFEITGFQIGSGNRYHVAYGVTVLAPDGKPFVRDPEAANLQSESFYPAQFVPGSIDLTIGKSSARGNYIVVLKVRDLIANQVFETKQPFSIE